MATSWAELVLGVWIIISPWVLGFSSISVMRWSNLLVGVLIVLINVWAIFGKKISQGETDKIKNS